MSDPIADWRTTAQRRRDLEHARLTRLPDLRGVALSREAWEARSLSAGLALTFDTDGRVSPPSDDETYDGIEKAMREEGRDADAARFSVMRPPRRAGLPTWDGPPDPLRRGDLERTFGLAVRDDGGVLRASEVKARTERDRWVHLGHHHGDIRLSGGWCDLSDQVFDALIAATDRVFGAIPRLEVPPLTPRFGVGVGCQAPCGGCGRRLDRSALVLAIEAGMGHALRLAHLCWVCAYREVPADLAAAVEAHRWGDRDQLSVVRRLERGPLGRCTACRALITRGAWRLSAVLVEGALHLACAVDAEPEGFARALEQANDFEEAEVWRAKLAELPPSSTVLRDPLQKR